MLDLLNVINFSVFLTTKIKSTEKGGYKSRVNYWEGKILLMSVFHFNRRNGTRYCTPAFSC